MDAKQKSKVAQKVEMVVNAATQFNLDIKDKFMNVNLKGDIDYLIISLRKSIDNQEISIQYVNLKKDLNNIDDELKGLESLYRWVMKVYNKELHQQGMKGIQN